MSDTKVKGNIQTGSTIVIGSINDKKVVLSGDIKTGAKHIPNYDGPYTVIPGDEVIILTTKDMKCLENITVNPVPSNYGKIGWNGSYLTVS